ncbi:MAG TPA: tetratricopeptide repeat protein [Solirubrobacterales bacterium]|nr:tetratricopeptide repeat protein [Solirubrobacterales bacterium]
MPLTPGQARVERQLLAAASETASGGKGRVLFVAGPPGRGRSHLLEAGGERLKKELPGVRVALAATPGTRGDRGEPRQDGLDDVLTASATGLAALDPGVTLLAALAALSRGVRRLVGELRDTNQRFESIELLTRVLLEAIAEDPGRPIVCLVDDADDLAGSWWTSVRFPIASQLANGLPVVLVFALDGPAALPEEPSDTESPGCFAARSLANRGIGEWAGLAALTEDDLVSWLGPAPRRLRETAMALGGGNAGTIVELWRSWQVRGVIDRDSRERWRLRDPDGVLPDALECLGSRVEAMLGGRWDAAHDWLPALLACGALEGRSFTAQAVADALDLDLDAAIDLLDELVDDGHPDRGVLRDLGALAVPNLMRDDSKALWRYAFVRHVDWLAAKSWLDDEDRPGLTAAMAFALAELLEPDEQLVAHVVARMLREAGNLDAAAYFEGLSYHASRAVLRGQARHLLGAPTTGWSPSDYRDAADLLVDASNVLDGEDPLPGLLAFAERAAGMAAMAGEPGRLSQALALRRQGTLLERMGQVNEARQRLLAARALVAEGAPETLAHVLMHLGDLEALDEERLDPARSLLHEASKLFAKCQHKQGQGTCTYYLGHLELKAENYDLARECAEGARRIAEECDDEDLAMTSLHLLGTIEDIAGDDSVAHDCALRSLEYMRKQGDSGQEAECLCLLASTELRRREYKASWDHAGTASALMERLGVQADLGMCRFIQGQAAMMLGERDVARACLLEAKEMLLGLGRTKKAAEVRALLDEL